ncbi:MAG: hypothetical protein WAM85_23420 [Terracidiphilus sp.]
MRTMRRISWPILLACMAVSLTFSQATGKKSLNVPVNGNTIVRFFYLPPYSYFHVPLAFRVVGKDDPRLGTAPLANPEDRTPYISLPKMQNLIAALAHADLSWQESKKLETPTKIQPSAMTDKMEITVFSSGGTYRAFVAPNRLCETLAPLDAALEQPRARWEFQLFRVNYHCTVPGFNRNAFPEHDEPTQ